MFNAADVWYRTQALLLIRVVIIYIIFQFVCNNTNIDDIKVHTHINRLSPLGAPLIPNCELFFCRFFKSERKLFVVVLLKHNRFQWEYVTSYQFQSFCHI